MSQAVGSLQPRRRGYGRRTLISAVALVAVVVAAFGAGTLLREGAAPAPAVHRQPAVVTTDTTIASLQARLTKNPADSEAGIELGAAYLQKVRETGDPTYYGKAGAVLNDVLAREPGNASAMAWYGALQLSLHNFRDGLEWGLKAHAANPESLEPYPDLIDGYVELGQYEQAVATTDEFVGLRPDLPSYTRVAYLRELYGDRPGAAEALTSALDTTAPNTEGGAWTRVQLGNLYLTGGNPDGAEQEYLRTLAAMPDYAPALAGLGKVAAARGDYAKAIELLTKASQRIPLPEYVVPLGEIYQVSGDQAGADEQFGIVRIEMQLLASNGLNTDLEFALFEADHPTPNTTPEQVVTTARAALAARPSIYGHDVLAWALYRAGQYDEAQSEITEALRLGTQDATLFFHAGMIAKARGDKLEAQRDLQTALRINPSFSVLHAPEARAALEELAN